MTTTVSHSPARPLAIIAASVLLSACADEIPVAPNGAAITPASFAAAGPGRAQADPIATLRRVTARYHDINAAIDDGFVFLHGCESRPGEGPVGELWVHFERLLDGVIDPSAPDALLYLPRTNAPPKLLGAELAIPYGLWTGQQPPRFMGAEFQREDEFGVFGLHVWIWNRNPEGMFAESNPNVTCGDE